MAAFFVDGFAHRDERNRMGRSVRPREANFRHSGRRILVRLDTKSPSSLRPPPLKERPERAVKTPEGAWEGCKVIGGSR